MCILYSHLNSNHTARAQCHTGLVADVLDSVALGGIRISNLGGIRITWKPHENTDGWAPLEAFQLGQG